MLNEFIQSICSLVDKIASLALGAHKQKVAKEDFLRVIIYYRRQLPTLLIETRQDRDTIRKFHQKVAAGLRTYFGVEFEECYSKNTLLIAHALYYGSEITVEMAEESLTEFIKLCRKHRFRVQ